MGKAPSKQILCLKHGEKEKDIRGYIALFQTSCGGLHFDPQPAQLEKIAAYSTADLVAGRLIVKDITVWIHPTQ
jgi:hypothetical protein